ncbi:unnamed protein product [Diatraea saccharalis]|uniref:Tetraspanin n=1 Tax=Diatraea saccharalis TaxID=40085 RepID=A0A9N9R3A2_9NEOP|nr:unnamed protein product [Diatraea saccharalis]
MGCGEFLVKYILFFANLFFALAGLTLLVLGVVVQLRITDLSNLADGQVQIAPISSMVVGGIVFLIAFFGCCGAIRESNCMLVTYAIFMLILMVVKIALATVIFVSLDSLLGQIPDWLTQSFKTDQQAFHALENTFRCCGPTGAGSYMDLVLPNSCCDTPPCVPLVNAYSGCDTIVKEFLRTFGLIIGIIAIAVGAIQLVAAVFALCLANHARNKYRRSTY